MGLNRGSASLSWLHLDLDHDQGMESTGSRCGLTKTSPLVCCRRRLWVSFFAMDFLPDSQDSVDLAIALVADFECRNAQAARVLGPLALPQEVLKTIVGLVAAPHVDAYGWQVLDQATGRIAKRGQTDLLHLALTSRRFTGLCLTALFTSPVLRSTNEVAVFLRCFEPVFAIRIESYLNEDGRSAAAALPGRRTKLYKDAVKHVRIECWDSNETLDVRRGPTPASRLSPWQDLYGTLQSFFKACPRLVSLFVEPVHDHDTIKALAQRGTAFECKIYRNTALFIRRPVPYQPSSHFDLIATDIGWMTYALGQPHHAETPMELIRAHAMDVSQIKRLRVELHDWPWPGNWSWAELLSEFEMSAMHSLSHLCLVGTGYQSDIGPVFAILDALSSNPSLIHCTLNGFDFASLDEDDSLWSALPNSIQELNLVHCTSLAEHIIALPAVLSGEDELHCLTRLCVVADREMELAMYQQDLDATCWERVDDDQIRDDLGVPAAEYQGNYADYVKALMQEVYIEDHDDYDFAVGIQMTAWVDEFRQAVREVKALLRRRGIYGGTPDHLFGWVNGAPGGTGDGPWQPTEWVKDDDSDCWIDAISNGKLQNLEVERATAALAQKKVADAIAAAKAAATATLPAALPLPNAEDLIMRRYIVRTPCQLHFLFTSCGA